jgi:hypothetical protein
LPGKLLKITNEVSLVVIAAIGGHSCPSALVAVYRTEDLLEPKDATKQLRPYPYFLQKPALQLSATDARSSRKRVHRYLAATMDDFSSEAYKPGIVLIVTHSLNQQTFYNVYPVQQATSLAASRNQLALELRGQVTQLYNPVRQFLHRDQKKGTSATGVKTNAQCLHGAHGDDKHWSRHLPYNKVPGLTHQQSVFLLLFEWCAEVQN